MVIIKMGDVLKSVSNYNFICDNCGCEWLADKNEVKITPPPFPHEVYMKCPNCRKRIKAQTYEQIIKREQEEREQEERARKEAWEYQWEEMRRGRCDETY